MRSTPATASSQRTPASRRPSRRQGLTWNRLSFPSRCARGADKLVAKRIAREAARARPPGRSTPVEIGFPLPREGGCKGRRPRHARCPLARAELEEARAAAEREAVGAFGDGSLYLERYLKRPRHVEVQLLADAHGGRSSRSASATAPSSAAIRRCSRRRRRLASHPSRCDCPARGPRSAFAPRDRIPRAPAPSSSSSPATTSSSSS